jgi:hydrogenase maturation protein HypF
MAGADAAVRHPARMAIAYLRAAGLERTADLPAVADLATASLAALEAQLDTGTGTVPCSSAGRLFDAVSALLGVRQRIRFEGQAAIELEILAAASPDPDIRLAMPVDGNGVVDHRPLIADLVCAFRAAVPVGELAREFHAALAVAIAQVCLQVAARTGVNTVGLTGGVFQNALLTSMARRHLEQAGLQVLTHRLVPPNDGGLSLGQAVIAASAEYQGWKDD